MFPNAIPSRWEQITNRLLVWGAHQGGAELQRDRERMFSGCTEHSDALFLPIWNEMYPVDRSSCVEVDIGPPGCSWMVSRMEVKNIEVLV